MRLFYTFPKGINPKVKVIAKLELKLVYLEAVLEHFSHYATETTQ